MDYSAANTEFWNAVIQMGIIAGSILLANMLIRRVGFIRKSLMPVSVLAGFILLALKYAGLVPFDPVLMEMLVYHGIALGFIAMSLRVIRSGEKQQGNLTAFKSGAVIVSTYLVQGILGLLITMGLAWTLMPGFFKAAGLLLPMGYGQGPGQANNVGSSYEALGFIGGRSFGLSIAAAGYLCACVVGVILLNVLLRRGKLGSGGKNVEDLSVGFFQDKNEIPISESVDKLSVQIAMVLVVYLITYGATLAITTAIEAASASLAQTLNPLIWGFNFIVGSAIAIIVRTVLEWGKHKGIIVRQYQNNYLLNRISGFFFDIMIVAGIASINIEDLSGLWLPFLLMAVAGGVVTWLYLKYVCKKVYPGYYYEGLISMYGMLTGTISSGILLLREIDTDLATPAANNLVSGSSYGIILGAPMLVLVGLAPKSDGMCVLTLVLAIVYLLILLALILKLKGKSK